MKIPKGNLYLEINTTNYSLLKVQYFGDKKIAINLVDTKNIFINF